MNEGAIKWRAPLGIVRELAAKGIRNTGNPVRLHRNGLAAELTIGDSLTD